MNIHFIIYNLKLEIPSGNDSQVGNWIQEFLDVNPLEKLPENRAPQPNVSHHLGLSPKKKLEQGLFTTQKLYFKEMSWWFHVI